MSDPITAPTDFDTALEPNRAAARFVLVAQTLVIVAFAVGLSVEAGASFSTVSSIVAALIVAMISLRKLNAARARRPAAPETVAFEAPLEAAAPAPVAREPEAPSWHADLAAHVPVADAAAPGPALPTRDTSLPPPMPRYRDPLPFEVPPAINKAPAQTPVLPNDFWSLRPVDLRQPAAAVPVEPVLTAPALQIFEAPALAFEAENPPLKETDVEAIQSLIKKLADEVNLADQQRAQALTEQAVTEPSFPPPVDMTATQIADLPPPVPQAAPRAFEPEAAVSQSLDALRVTAQTMRQPSHLVFGHELPPPVPALSPANALRVSAISAGRIDVLLEPILGLSTQDAQHFEVSLRLRGEDGAVLAVNGDDTEIRGSGVLAMFDRAKLERTTSVARRLGERGKSGAVFSAYHGESLIDAEFQANASSIAERPGAASQLVLTFTQADARSFEGPEWDAIHELKQLGFQFAMSAVTDLDMDIEGLVAAGFNFIKLEADVFLTGLVSPDGTIPSADVCRYLAGLGLTLVVERIDDEDKFARVFGFGAVLGQGQLFGGARVLKAEAVGQAAA